MLLTIKTLQQKSFQMEVELTDTILSVKQKIEERESQAPTQQKLIHSGKILADDKTVGDYKITEKDFLVVMFTK
ncbi:UV excision repair protein RAD23 B, partial [Quaeritorhiza haematococci]